MGNYIKVLFTDRGKAPTFTTIAASESVFKRVLEGRLNIISLKGHCNEMLNCAQAVIYAPLSVKLAKMIPDNLAIINREFEGTDFSNMRITTFAVLDKFYIVALREPLYGRMENIPDIPKLFRGLNDTEVAFLKSLLQTYFKESSVWINRFIEQVEDACNLPAKESKVNTLMNVVFCNKWNPLEEIVFCDRIKKILINKYGIKTEAEFNNLLGWYDQIADLAFQYSHQSDNRYTNGFRAWLRRVNGVDIPEGAFEFLIELGDILSDEGLDVRMKGYKLTPMNVSSGA